MTNSIHAAKKLQDLSKKYSGDKIMHTTNKIGKMRTNEFIGSGITPAKNEIKYM